MKINNTIGNIVIKYKILTGNSRIEEFIARIVILDISGKANNKMAIKMSQFSIKTYLS